MTNSANILVCDDDPLISSLLKKIIAKEGHTVHCVESGRECLNLVEKLKPDLILLDLNMQGMSGYEVCKKIKDDENTKEIPVVFVSAMSADSDILKGYELGGDDYITKPISGEETIAKIRHALSASSRVNDLEGQIDSLSQIAHNAMLEASFIGAVAHFSTQTAFINDYEGLSESLLVALERFDLKAKIIAFSEFAGELHYGHSDLNEKDIKLMKSAREVYLRDGSESINRFHIIKQYLITHCNNAIILAKPLPLSDEAKVGQIEDVMGHLSSLYSVRLLDIDHTNEMSAYIKANTRIMKEMENTLTTLESTFIDNNQGLAGLLDDLLTRFERATHQLLLSEDDENALLSILHEAMKHINKCNKTSKDIDHSLMNILGVLQNVDYFQKETPKLVPSAGQSPSLRLVK